MVRSRLPLGCALALTAPALAEADQPAFHPEIQFRPRYEFDTGREGLGPEAQVHFVTHRVRLGASLDWRAFSVRAVFQDVRAWGEETDTRRDFSGDGIDLAIGTFTWRPRADLTLVLGRDEVSLHDERLVARANWRQPGRHFDGGRLTFEDGRWAAEAAGFVAIDGNTFDFANTDQVRPGYGDQTLSWVRGGRQTGALTAQAVLVLDDRREVAGAEVLRFTPGLFVQGSRGPLRGRVEAYGQLGTIDGGGQAVRAFMVGLLGTVAPEVAGRPAISLGYDVLSGDEDPDDGVFTRFDTLRGANHQYYGHLDIAYFLQGGRADDRGLHDPYLRLDVRPAPWFTGRVDQHLFAPFSRAEEGALIAAETDLRLQFQAHEAVAVWAGASVWVPLADTRAPVEGWAWLMLDVAWRGPALRVPAPRQRREDGDGADTQEASAARSPRYGVEIHDGSRASWVAGTAEPT